MYIVRLGFYVVFLSVLVNSACYKTRYVSGPRVKTGAPSLGTEEGPNSMSGSFKFDLATLSVTGSASGNYTTDVLQTYKSTSKTCKQEDATFYNWLLIGTGILAAGGVTCAIGFGATKGKGFLPGTIVGNLAGTLPFSIIGVNDLFHGRDELFDCEVDETTDEKKEDAKTTRRKLVDYEVDVTGLGANTTVTPNQEGLVVVLVKKLESCPNALFWVPPLSKSGIPNAADHVSQEEFSITARRGDESFHEQTFRAPVFRLEDYLRQQASRFVPKAERRPHLSPVAFTLEDKNSRVPVRNAAVRVRVLSEPTQKKAPEIPEAAQRFAETLAKLPCDSRDRFLLHVRALMQEKRSEPTAPQVPFCKIEHRECTVNSDDKGRIQIGFFPNTNVHIEIRHPKYYYQELDLTVGNSEPRWKRKHNNEIKRDPYNAGAYVILLQDVGQRIRRGQ